MAENRTQDIHTTACAECGTVIGKAAEFCWRCGATFSRDEYADQRGSSGAATPQGNDAGVFGLVDRLRSASTGAGAGPAAVRVPAAAIDEPVNVLGNSVPVLSTNIEPPTFGLLDDTPQTAKQQNSTEFSFLRKIVHPVEEDEEELKRQRERRKMVRRIILATAALTLVVVVVVFRHPLAEYSRRINSGVRAYVSEKLSPKPPEERRVEDTQARGAPSTKAPGRVRRNGRAANEPAPMGVVVEGQPNTSAMYIDETAMATPTSVAGGPTLMNTPRSTMRVTISPSESRALLVRHISPVYPQEARKRRLEGSVTVRATIGTDGIVRNVQGVEGDRILLKAAMDAVKQWMYRPYLRDGQALEVETLVVVEFSLASGV